MRLYVTIAIMYANASFQVFFSNNFLIYLTKMHTRTIKVRINVFVYVFMYLCGLQIALLPHYCYNFGIAARCSCAVARLMRYSVVSTFKVICAMLITCAGMVYGYVEGQAKIIFVTNTQLNCLIR